MSSYNKKNPESIQAMFGSIAKNYDRTNSVLSFQLHKHWNKKLIKSTASKQDLQTQIDLCCGTGEIAFEWLKHNSPGKNAYLIDFCSQMLECAKEKARFSKFDIQNKIQYIQADVQALPLSDNIGDFATIAYGIRNVKDPQKCFQEAFRVLKNGGTLGILELTEPNNVIIRTGHQFYLRYILPIIGKMLTSNQEAYEYLCNSIHTFIKPSDLVPMLKAAGFTEIRIQPINFGIATIITAKKA